MKPKLKKIGKKLSKNSNFLAAFGFLRFYLEKQHVSRDLMVRSFSLFDPVELMRFLEVVENTIFSENSILRFY